MAAASPAAVATSASAIPGATTPRFVEPGLSDAFERRHDPPDRPEESDERRHAGSRREKRDVLFQFVDLHHRRAQQRPVHCRKALQCWTTARRLRIGRVGHVRARLSQLRGQFGVTRLKETDERARGERTTDRLHFRELVAASKDVEELRRLLPRASERPQLVEDDPPRHDRDHAQDEEHTQRQGRPGDQIEDGSGRTLGRNSSRRLQQQGGERAS